MNQSLLLVQALKRCLKAKSLSYRDLASHLKISETSVKRIFSKGSFTIARLEEVCEFLGIEFYELAKMARSSEVEDSAILNLEQEKALAEDPKLFSFFYLLMAGSKPDAIQNRYKFSAVECTRCLVKLDKLKLLELRPQNQFRLLVSENVRWIDSGPLNSIYSARIRQEFLNAEFEPPFGKFRLLNGYLSENSLRMISKKVDKLIAEFLETSDIDGSMGGKVQGKRIWLLLAFRPWTFSTVAQLRRERR